jgi:membrane protein implicated in regulation of membrane protease activity
MEEYAVYIWVAVTILAVLVEAATSQMVSIWFVFGALGALITGLFGGSFLIQVIVFVIVTIIALILTRPLVKNASLFKKEDTNAGRYVGKEGIVTVKINNLENEGQVSVLGSTWSARSYDGIPIEENEHVIIEKIEGVKLIVSKK